MVTAVTDRARGGVGESVVRVDAVPKVTGAFDYASDLRADAMLWGATLRSPYPFARICRMRHTVCTSCPVKCRQPNVPAGS